jgi:hypothetical protein
MKMNRNQTAVQMTPTSAAPPGPGWWLRVLWQTKTGGKEFNAGNEMSVEQAGKNLEAYLSPPARLKWTPPHVKPTGAPRDLPASTPTLPSNPPVEVVTVGGDAEASKAQMLKRMTEKCQALAPWLTPIAAETWAEGLIMGNHAAADIWMRADVARQARVRRERGVVSL